MSLIINPQETTVILIGTSEYHDSEFTPISPIKQNIEDLYKLFLDNNIFGGINKENIVTFFNENNNTILEGIEKYSKLATDSLIIYYSGHGERLKNKNLYLTAINTKREYKSTAIDFNTVNEYINESKALKKFLILDCCYSGLAAMGNEDEFFDEKLEIKGTYIITSAPSNDKSYFEPKNQHTYFTGELIKILTDGLQNNSAFLDFTEIFQAIKSAFASKTLPPPKQKSTIDSDKIFFANNYRYYAYSNTIRKIDQIVSTGNLDEAEIEYKKVLVDFKNYDKNSIEKKLYAINLIKKSDVFFEEDKFEDAYRKLGQGFTLFEEAGIKLGEVYKLKLDFCGKILAIEKNLKEELIKKIEPQIKQRIEEEIYQNPHVVEINLRKKLNNEFEQKLEIEKKELRIELEKEISKRYTEKGIINKNNVLYLSSNPEDTSRLRIDLEIRELMAVFKNKDLDLVLSLATRPEDIENLLLDSIPKIVQMSVHAEPYSLVLEDSLGKTNPVSGEKIAQFFSIFAKEIECVILNGCHTADTAYYLSKDIKYVIGIEGIIPDNISISFSKSFFKAFLKERSVEFAFDFGVRATKISHSNSNFELKLYVREDFDPEKWRTISEIREANSRRGGIGIERPIPQYSGQIISSR